MELTDKSHNQSGGIQDRVALYTGEVIDRINQIVDEALSNYHYCSICDARTILPPDHPHCGMCESALLLTQCKNCHDWYCKTGCQVMHLCGGGPEPTQGRF